LYVIGGETEKSVDDTVAIYDPTTNTWTIAKTWRRNLMVE